MTCNFRIQIMLHEICDFLLKNYVGIMTFPLTIICMGFGSILHLKFGRKCDIYCKHEI